MGMTSVMLFQQIVQQYKNNNYYLITGGKIWNKATIQNNAAVAKNIAI